jgi:integrase
MGTITSRQRKGGMRHTVQIRIKRNGKIIYTESKTFDRYKAAEAWNRRREAELAEPGALETAQVDDPSLAKVIERYVEDSTKGVRRTKAQVLRAIAAADIGQMRASQIDSPAIVQFIQGLDVLPQTAGNYLSHLTAVFRVARPAWGYPLREQEIDDARTVLKKLGATGRSRQRTRRPTREELDRIMAYYEEMEKRERAAIPMQKLIVFAMYSTRRQEEITRITWEDYERDRVLVRDMKHPGQKVGNNTWCDLPPEAARVIESMPRGEGPIFPYNYRSISSSFTRACAFLVIADLRFHDLRHEGTSRLFEMGWNIPHVAAVTGHRSWVSLRRYTHLRQMGDRWAGWPWLDKVAPLSCTADPAP